MKISGVSAACPAIVLVIMACLVPPRAGAQSIASRVAAVRDGKVRMTFASRPDMCGNGNGISTGYIRGRNNRTSWSPGRSEDVVYDRDCSEGPVRLVVQMAGGKPARIDTYIGGQWRPAPTVADLGTVSVKAAAEFLLGVAKSQSGKASVEAIFPVTLADSTDVVRSLAPLAENESLPDETRGQAIFWLGQARSPGSAEYLRRLYGRVRSEDVKDKIIFSISQNREPDNAQWLLDLVSNSSEPIEMRKKALFWAGQGGVSMNKLTALYSGKFSREMKDQLIFVLSQRREPAALKKLMDIAKSDPDREARRKAMFWLGQSNDARAAGFLTDIINR